MGATKKQVTCKVNGEEYTITPTFLTIDEIEAHLSLSDLATRLQMGDVRVSSLARCLHSALVAEGYNDVDYPTVGHAVINEIGVEKAAEKVSEIVDIALGGGPSKKKGSKKKAAAKKKSAK